MQEKWTRWYPTQKISAKKYSILSIIEDNDALVVILNGDDKKGTLEIFFDGLVASFSKTEIVYKEKLLLFLEQEYDRAFYTTWTFFEATDSAFLRKMSFESAGISDYCKFRHFILLADNFVVDVLTNGEPAIKMMSEQNLL